jgi:DNA-binding MarR family transcriptional regulator
MAKAKRTEAMKRLQSVARLSRTALAARLLAHGFYPGQDQIMLALEEEDGRTPSQLAAQLGVRPPTVTKTINRLQAQGFVSKRSSEGDGRQAHVWLTEAGREAMRAIEKAVSKSEKQAMRGLDKKEQKLLFKLLGRIEANLSAGSADTPVSESEPDEEEGRIPAEALT